MVTINVKVKTNSGRFLVETDRGKITIYTKAPPEADKANQEIIKQLTKMTGGPVRILSGRKTSRKVLMVPEKWKEITTS